MTRCSVVQATKPTMLVSGLIEFCNLTFGGTSGQGLNVKTGAKIRYSRIVSQALRASAVTQTGYIYHCSLTNAIDTTNLTNGISTNLNVVDANA